VSLSKAHVAPERAWRSAEGAATAVLIPRGAHVGDVVVSRPRHLALGIPHGAVVRVADKDATVAPLPRPKLHIGRVAHRLRVPLPGLSTTQTRQSRCHDILDSEINSPKLKKKSYIQSRRSANSTLKVA
jgi:hypothetical protein